MKDFFLCQMLFEGTLVDSKHACPRLLH